MRFGKQILIVRNKFLTTDVSYPQIRNDNNKHMKVMYDDDLLSLADYYEAVEFEDGGALSIDEGEEGYDDEVD